MDASAMLKIKNEKLLIFKWRKSVTYPSGNLSNIFPSAPPIIIDKANFFVLSLSFFKSTNIYTTIRIPTKVSRLDISREPRSRNPNAIPELKVR